MSESGLSTRTPIFRQTATAFCISSPKARAKHYDIIPAGTFTIPNGLSVTVYGMEG